MAKVEENSNITISNDAESLMSNQGNSHDSFFQSERGRKPIEIKTPGRHVLSVTEKGESVVFYDPYFFEEGEAYELMECLLNTTNWQTKNITIRGIKYSQPRLVAWYGPFPYSYSGTTMEPAKMPDYISDIKKKVEQYLRKNGINVLLNSVLLNLYRHNKDSVSWHSDDELAMGVSPTIASVSLGETRKFEMRRKLKHFEDESFYTEGDEYFVHLSNGSLLIMDGSMQKDWQHRVPKEYHERHGRINLTFRTVYKVKSLLPFLSSQIQKPVGRATKKSCQRKIVYDEETLDMNSECSGIVNRTQDLSSLKTDDETTRSEEERGIEPSYNETSLKTDDKIDEKVGKDIETHSYNKITLKTEDTLNESNEELDSQHFYSKKSNPVNNFNDDQKNAQSNMQNKNIDYDSSCSSNDIKIHTNLGKNKSSCTKDSQSVSTNSPLINMKEDACKVKSEPVTSTDNEMTFNDVVEEFIPINTFTVSSEKTTFGSYNLKNLLNYSVELMNSELLLDYAVALKNRILESIHEFKFCEKSELEVLCKLTDGTQTEENQKFITRRMCLIVDKALKLQRDSPNILKSVKTSRQPYHKNRNPYSQRLNQVNSKGSHCK